ncbi:MAG TPA: DoxX family protein [Puia sp.]|jgi:putative oxidoreductase|nr:DoxX family protein [Puia sp.]
MKKLLSTGYSDTMFTLAMILLRSGLGVMILLNHGIPKLANYGDLQNNFFDPFHIGHRWSLILCVFAEVFAAMLLVLGLFSRIGALILAIDMSVAVFMYHQGQPLKNSEEAVIFLVGFVCIILVGPGKWSVDGMTGR